MSLVLYVDASQAASRVVLELVAVVASASLSIQRVDRALPIPHPLEDHDKIPLLEDGDVRIHGARAIALHIASKANVEERWFGSPGQPDRASIEGLLDSVLPSTVEAFRGLLHHSFYAPLLGVLEPDVNTIREYALETRGALVTLNSILARSQYLAAGTQRPSFVDLVAYHELLQLRLLPSMDLTPYQHVKRWQEQLRGDASLQTCAFDAPLAEYASSLAAMFQALEGEGEEHTTADDYDHDGSGHSGHCCSREHEASK